MYVKHELKEKKGFYQAYIDVGKDSYLVKKYFILNKKIGKNSLETILKKIKKESITILDLVYVERENRKQRNGQKLLDHLIERSESSIILICEKNLPFIESWYEKNGFKVIGSIAGLPIMIKEK